MRSNELRIRPATAADAATVLGFIRALAAFEREPGAVEVDVATLRTQLADPLPPFECLLCERDGEALGFALYFFAYSTWRGRRVLHLEDLFVAPGARRAGVGLALMRALARIAVARDCARFEWSVLDWNEDALRFYRRLGAAPVPGWTVLRLSGAPLASLAAPAPPERG
ncbi:MAG: GNAT family N-acetyltransferase [Polyangiaceae bacterium]|nr:GNAT family N-acetyltransferase [Polyangiaceae bacterium]